MNEAIWDWLRAGRVGAPSHLRLLWRNHDAELELLCLKQIRAVRRVRWHEETPAARPGLTVVETVMKAMASEGRVFLTTTVFALDGLSAPLGPWT